MNDITENITDHGGGKRNNERPKIQIIYRNKYQQGWKLSGSAGSAVITGCHERALVAFF